MRIGSSKDLEDQTLTALGKITAASEWRGVDGADAQAAKLRALHRLMRQAEDCDADALLDVDYSEEILQRGEAPGVAALKRIHASAVAVKLKSA